MKDKNGVDIYIGAVVKVGDQPGYKSKNMQDFIACVDHIWWDSPRRQIQVSHNQKVGKHYVSQYEPSDVEVLTIEQAMLWKLENA
jgi:hypothetical protein